MLRWAQNQGIWAFPLPFLMLELYETSPLVPRGSSRDLLPMQMSSALGEKQLCLL